MYQCILSQTHVCTGCLTKNRNTFRICFLLWVFYSFSHLLHPNAITLNQLQLFVSVFLGIILLYTYLVLMVALSWCLQIYYLLWSFIRSHFFADVHTKAPLFNFNHCHIKLSLSLILSFCIYISLETATSS